MSASLNQQFATPIPTTRPAWFLEEIDVALSIFQATCAIQASEGQIVDAQGMLDHVQIPGIKSAWEVYWSAWNLFSPHSQLFLSETPAKSRVQSVEILEKHWKLVILKIR